MALGRIGPTRRAAVPDLIPLLGDKSERIREEASVALGRIGPAAVEPLITASADQDVNGSRGGGRGLGHLARAGRRGHAGRPRAARTMPPRRSGRPR